MPCLAAAPSSREHPLLWPPAAASGLSSPAAHLRTENNHRHGNRHVCGAVCHAAVAGPLTAFTIHIVAAVGTEVLRDCKPTEAQASKRCSSTTTNTKQALDICKHTCACTEEANCQ
jgi:hypothetical protein